MGSQPAALLVTDAVSLPASLVLWALRTFEDTAEGGKRLSVITQASQLDFESLKLESSSLDTIVSLAENSGFNSLTWLTDMAKILKPGGVLVVQEPLIADTQTEVALERSILLAGYVNSKPFDMVEGLEVARDGEFLSQHIVFRANKPTWDTGSSFTIKKRALDLPTESNVMAIKLTSEEVHDIEVSGKTVPKLNEPSAFKLPTFEADVDDELVDEDSLLNEDDLKRPELPQVDDCDVGKAVRKACKNCSCGRAELEEKDRKGPTAEELNNPQSACGNCGLGDAFRCGGCPYRGLPPFQLGEKIILQGTLVAADV